MRRYPYLVGDKASNKPDASTAYNIAATALDGARTFAAALSAGDIEDGDEMAVRAYKYDANGNPSGAQEICWCTFNDSSPDTLTRGTLIYSNTGSKTDWSATGEDFAPALEVVEPPERGWTLDSALSTGPFTSNTGPVAFEDLDLANFDYIFRGWFAEAEGTAAAYRMQVGYGGGTTTWAPNDNTFGCDYHRASVSHAGAPAGNGYVDISPNLGNVSDTLLFHVYMTRQPGGHGGIAVCRSLLRRVGGLYSGLSQASISAGDSVAGNMTAIRFYWYSIYYIGSGNVEVLTRPADANQVPWEGML